MCISRERRVSSGGRSLLHLCSGRRPGFGENSAGQAGEWLSRGSGGERIAHGVNRGDGGKQTRQAPVGAAELTHYGNPRPATFCRPYRGCGRSYCLASPRLTAWAILSAPLPGPSWFDPPHVPTPHGMGYSLAAATAAVANAVASGRRCPGCFAASLCLCRG